MPLNRVKLGVLFVLSMGMSLLITAPYSKAQNNLPPLDIIHDYLPVRFNNDPVGNLQIGRYQTEGPSWLGLTDNTLSRSCPSWSPDGTQIAYATYLGGIHTETTFVPGKMKLYRMRPNGSNQVQLTFGSTNDDFPKWSPDGQKLIFERYIDAFNGMAANAEVFSIDIATGVEHNLSDHPERDYSPTFSRTGDQIAFTSYRNGGQKQIYIANADGTNPQPLALPIGMHASSPEWSPDNNQIAFFGGFGMYENYLYVVNTDGSDLLQMADGSSDYADHQWLPDGSGVVFNSGRSLYSVPLNSPLAQPEHLVTLENPNGELFDARGCFDIFPAIISTMTPTP